MSLVVFSSLLSRARGKKQWQEREDSNPRLGANRPTRKRPAPHVKRAVPREIAAKTGIWGHAGCNASAPIGYAAVIYSIYFLNAY
jgi:hypothetical protein